MHHYTPGSSRFFVNFENIVEIGWNRWLDIFKSFLAHFKPFLGSKKLKNQLTFTKLRPEAWFFALKKLPCCTLISFVHYNKIAQLSSKQDVKACCRKHKIKQSFQGRKENERLPDTKYDIGCSDQRFALQK